MTQTSLSNCFLELTLVEYRRNYMATFLEETRKINIGFEISMICLLESIEQFLLFNTTFILIAQLDAAFFESDFPVGVQ